MVVTAVLVAAVVTVAARVATADWIIPDTNVGMRPETVSFDGRKHYFQIPDEPKGLVVIFPGCDRFGFGFWPYNGSNCPECAGLPEDLGHAKQAMARKYAVLVPSATATNGCWSCKVDLPVVKPLLEMFVKAHALSHAPLYVLGASSGGDMALYLASYLASTKSPLKVSGVLMEVSTNAAVNRSVTDVASLPPVAWVTLAQQKEIDAAKAHVVEYERDYHGKAGMATRLASNITSSFFADTHPLVDNTTSALIRESLIKLRVIDSAGQIVMSDFKDPPRAWQNELVRMVPFLQGNKDFQTEPFGKDAILQGLLVAQAVHEHVCDFLTAALVWFEQSGSSKFADLVRIYRKTRPAYLTMYDT